MKFLSLEISACEMFLEVSSMFKEKINSEERELESNPERRIFSPSPTPLRL